MFRPSVFYTSKNKKITTDTLTRAGFSLPADLRISGYIGSITYSNEKVKIEGKPFNQVFLCYYVKSRYGESIIPVGKDLNVLVYASGIIKSPKISKVVRINLNDEHNISEVRSEILESERQGDYQPYQTVETYYGEGIFERFQNRNFPVLRELRRERKGEQSKANNSDSGEIQNGDGSVAADIGTENLTQGYGSLVLKIP